MRGFITIKGAWLFVAWLWLAGTMGASAQVTATNVPVADSFVSSLTASGNYGAAGALSVSGPIATNSVGQQEGLLDTFLQFNLSGVVSDFNSSFGAGQWAISSVKLNLTEQGAPNNTMFNRGVGQFEVRWIANDSWLEGTGIPNNPTTNGITYANEPSILNSNLDVSLGIFVNGGSNGLVRFSLGTPSVFLGDIAAGGLVSLDLTATSNSTVGFTFNSKDFTTPSARPFFEVTAVTIPEPATVGLVAVAAVFLAALFRTRVKSNHVATN